MWVVKQLAYVGPRQLANRPHTSLNDDSTSAQAAGGEKLLERQRAHAAAVKAAQNKAAAPRVRPETPQKILDLLEASEQAKAAEVATKAKVDYRPKTSIGWRSAPGLGRSESAASLQRPGSAPSPHFSAASVSPASTGHHTPTMLFHTPAPHRYAPSRSNAGSLHHQQRPPPRSTSSAALLTRSSSAPAVGPGASRGGAERPPTKFMVPDKRRMVTVHDLKKHAVVNSLKRSPDLFAYQPSRIHRMTPANMHVLQWEAPKRAVDEDGLACWVSPSRVARFARSR